MNRTMCKSKIHRATVSEANLNYVGSITIDKELMLAADLLPYEKVQVVNIDNGARFETYVIEGESNSGCICINGAAARLAQQGDLVIIISYGEFNEAELKAFEPKVVHVNESNAIVNLTHLEQARAIA